MLKKQDEFLPFDVQYILRTCTGDIQMKNSWHDVMPFSMTFIMICKVTSLMSL